MPDDQEKSLKRGGWRFKTKNQVSYDSAGDRTQNLWFRRPAPYPLGHGVADDGSLSLWLLIVKVKDK
jgi:hypothetical protein